MVDRRMVVGGRSKLCKKPWWTPSSLSCWFIAIVVFDAVILLVASGVRSSGSDAAGNGIANAFQTAFVETGALLVGCIALLFLIVRHKKIRIGLTVMLVLITLALSMLLQ